MHGLGWCLSVSWFRVVYDFGLCLGAAIWGSAHLLPRSGVLQRSRMLQLLRAQALLLMQRLQLLMCLPDAQQPLSQTTPTDKLPVLLMMKV